MWHSLNVFIVIHIFAIGMRHIVVANGDYSNGEFDFDVDDILSVQLMPVSWMVLDDQRYRQQQQREDEENRRDDMMVMRSNDGDSIDVGHIGKGFAEPLNGDRRQFQSTSAMLRVNGSVASALKTMRFHR